MKRNFWKIAAVVLLSVVVNSTAESVRADDQLVFISSFAKGEDGAIHACRLNPETGTLKKVRSTTDVEHPFFLALSPKSDYLYSIHAPGQFGGEDHEQVAAYKVNSKTGELTLLNRQSALGTAACYLDVDATGKTVVVANYLTGSVASFPVNRDGSLSEVKTLVQHTGSSVNESRQEGPHAHCIVISPDNRFVFAADLGIDQVLGYRLDPKAATIKAAPQPFVRTPPGAGPRHLTFHPNGKHVYVINELTNGVTVFDYNTKTGMLIEKQTLSTLPDDFDGTSYCADLKITPDGRFLYGTNRGHDSLAAYSIADDGRLKLIEIIPSLGKGPQNLAITDNGGLILCANMPGNNVAVFRIDGKTGRLTSTGDPIELKMPSCIMLP